MVEPQKQKDAPAASVREFDQCKDGSGYCSAVPSQDRIECSATNDDEIEVEQLSPLHPDENVRIHLARSNAVRLARNILFAAGFKSVLIATLDGGGGYCDVDDGDLPEHFGKAGPL